MSHHRLLCLLPLLLALLVGCPPDPEPDLVEPPLIDVRRDSLELTELAVTAVQTAPLWLQDDLAISLDKVDEEIQDELAAQITDAEDPNWIDEIAFAIAHTSPEVLEHNRFHPELFTINARYVYLADPGLDYVELVEVGTAGVDADWHTTATYRLDEDGTIVEKTIDRDTYYWYVVHPRLEDEMPMFIDAWSSEQPTDPENGWFWREFMWDRAIEECPADRECPILDGWMDGYDVLFRGTTSANEDDSAIARVYAFVWAAIAWGAGAERPVQPVRIYAVACGNCGEHADMGSAVARTALIPAQNVGAFSNDHVWDEFWNDGWVHFDVTGSGLNWFGNYKGGVGRDGIDNDCDGVADFADEDTDADGDGVSVADGDCRDDDPAVFPGAVEVANGYDDDCDGTADPGFVDTDLDGDGDGVSIGAGDCDDSDALRYPGAEELIDGRDDDCDGVADDGEDLADADEDGWAVAQGDCDDTRADIHPDAEELGNGLDDDCDGVADEELTEHDRDEDGYTMAGGDCNDLHAGIRPGVNDPGIGSNRLYTITSSRGDSHLSTERTVDYATKTSTLEFHVTDDAGVPVDGAVVSLFGTWAVYGEPELWNWSSEVITDLDGLATATVGETNPYGWAVVSGAGDFPAPGSLIPGPTFTVAGETYVIEPTVDAMPAAPDATQADQTGGVEPEVAVTIQVAVESYRIEADGQWSGSMSVAHDGGRVDVFVLDEDNYDLFQDEEPFEAHYVAMDVATDEVRLELPLDHHWSVVLANRDQVAATMVGSVTLRATPLEGQAFETDMPPRQDRFRIPPGDYYSLFIER